MATEITKTRKPIGVPRAQEKEAYKNWKAIPAMLRLLPETELKKMGYDIDDPVFMKLLSIRTKLEFSEFFKIGHNQPSIWDKDESFQLEVQKLSAQNNVIKFQKDVDFSFTQKVLKHGDAHRVKLWKQLYEGWTEKTENRNFNANVDVVELVKMIEARNAKIRATPDV